MTSAKPATSTLTAILVCTFGIFLLSAMDAAVKGLVVVIGAYNALLWRSILATATAGPAWALLAKTRPTRQGLKLHAMRGAVVAFVAFSFFWGLGRLPLAEAVALSFIAPLFALFLAALLLGERIGRSAIGASLLGIAGVVTIISGKFSHAGYAPDVFWGMGAVLASAVMYGYNLILARRQALVARPLEISCFQNLVMGLVLALAAPWVAVVPPADQWPHIAGVTALALTGHFLMSWAYARAEAQYLIPTEYSAFVWAVLLGWVFFSEPVGGTTLAGAALIIVGCLLASRSKPKLAEPIEVASV